MSSHYSSSGSVVATVGRFRWASRSQPKCSTFSPMLRSSTSVTRSSKCLSAKLGVPEELKLRQNLKSSGVTSSLFEDVIGDHRRRRGAKGDKFSGLQVSTTLRRIKRPFSHNPSLTLRNPGHNPRWRVRECSTSALFLTVVTQEPGHSRPGR